MSRIGKKLISLPSGVTVNVSGNIVKVKGPKGELSQEILGDITVSVKDGEVEVVRNNDEIPQRAKHGLYRSLISNMIVGVSEGFEKKLELVGVGYKASNTGNVLDLALGYSHNIIFEIPNELTVTTETVKGKNPLIILQSSDKQLLGQVAAKIRSLRKPEPYKGKGVRFQGEVVRRKAGKTAGK